MISHWFVASIWSPAKGPISRESGRSIKWNECPPLNRDEQARTQILIFFRKSLYQPVTTGHRQMARGRHAPPKKIAQTAHRDISGWIWARINLFKGLLGIAVQNCGLIPWKNYKLMLSTSEFIFHPFHIIRQIYCNQLCRCVFVGFVLYIVGHQLVDIR